MPVGAPFRGPVRGGTTAGMGALALTFDDGPDVIWTPRLLDLLRELRARATFFPIARRATMHPKLLERIRDEGHTIGLHCDRHERHCSRGLGWLRRDTDVALERLRRAGVRPAPKLWRTPWGEIAPSTVAVARERDLRLVGWTVDTHDWRGDSADQMFLATRDAIVHGSIVLAHDGLGPGARRDGAAETLRYVELLADHARCCGLSFEALG